MEAAIKRKISPLLYISFAGTILIIGTFIGSLFLILMIAGGGASQIENSNENKVPGVYPPNGLMIPMYYQWQYTGSQYAFGGGDIGTSGCGPTSFAMVATYLLGRKITPPDVVKWAGTTTYYVPDVGMSWSFFDDAVAHYQCGAVEQTTEKEKVLDALSNGQPVICSQRAGIFTGSGHFIVLRGITEEGKILINDPNDSVLKNFINREFDMDTEVDVTANAYWIFEKRQLSELGGTGEYRVDGTQYTQEELELIWAIVMQEDSGTYEGSLAVISCAMNRVDSPAWSSRGKNALEQLTSVGQFCYSIDSYWKRWLNGNVYDHVKLAVNDCLNNGLRNHNFTSFRSSQSDTTGSDGEYVGGNYYFN